MFATRSRGKVESDEVQTAQPWHFPGVKVGRDKSGRVWRVGRGKDSRLELKGVLTGHTGWVR